MMEKSYKNRRRYIRIPMISVIQAQVENDKPFPAMIVDISAGGLRIMTKHPLNVGSEILMTIPLDEYKVLKAVGNIIWSRETKLIKQYSFGVEFMGGIQFKEVIKEIQEYIQRYI